MGCQSTGLFLNEPLTLQKSSRVSSATEVAMPQVLQLVKEFLILEGVSKAIAPFLARSLIIIGILALSFLANFLAKSILLRWINFVIAKTETNWDDIILEKKVFNRLSQLAPSLVIYAFIEVAFPDIVGVQDAIRRIAIAYMIIVTAIVIDAFLNAVVAIYNTSSVAKSRPIKSYVQVAKIFVYLITIVLVITTLLDRSPWAFLSGLGALTAVIMLVFKDTILGFVASIQLVSYDMVRQGDWIEMPKYGADGDVIDVTLNTVKVQNWDKTISTIPTYALVSDTFRNWRGMQDSGGRRIKRAIVIDLNTIRFCSEEMLERFEKVRLIRDYIKQKRVELKAHNEKYSIGSDVAINIRRLTNVGTFRAYIVAYLKQHPKIRQNMTFLIRQLPPSDKGLPIEIYVFSADQVWANYEGIQADIFDHLLAVVPEFGLRVFQSPSGEDIRAALSLGR